MKRRQTSMPDRWLIADDRMGAQLWDAVRRLPPGSGVLVLYREMPQSLRARLVTKLRRLALSRQLLLVDETGGESARVHNLREIRTAGLRRFPLLFLSPIFPTLSHAEWKPIPRMRAATLARLAKVPVIALGGMDSRRYARIRSLGFHGWAGIGAFRT